MIKKKKISNYQPYIESFKENVILTSVAQDTGKKHLYTARNLISLFHLQLFSLCLKKSNTMHRKISILVRDEKR